MRFEILRPCGIDGVNYRAGDITDAIPAGSIDSASRMGLIRPIATEEPASATDSATTNETPADSATEEPANEKNSNATRKPGK